VRFFTSIQPIPIYVRTPKLLTKLSYNLEIFSRDILNNVIFHLVEMSKAADSYKPSLSPSSATYDVESSKKFDVIDLDMKLQHNTSTIRGPLRRG
jgi:hypothetical protein